VNLDWDSNRYILTKAFKDVPALVWLFYIEISGRIVIDHVEAFEEY
jgi:hypothetical protein